MKKFLRMLTHISIILSVVFIVFLFIDTFNPSMNFSDSDQARYLLWVLCFATLVSSIYCVYLDRKK